jgi:hypothetical protein
VSLRGWAVRAALLSALATAWSSPVLADEPVDTVILRSGIRHSGRVTEVVPEDHVTILDGSTTKVFPWSQVDRIVVTTIDLGPLPPTSKTTTPAPTPASEPEPTGPRVRMVLDSPKPVVLYRQPIGSTSWVLVCNTPCALEVPAGDLYRVTGNGVRPSKAFRLGATASDDVRIAVDPSSAAGEVLSGTAMVVGGLTALVGLSVVNSHSTRQDEGAGVAALGIGLTLSIGGLVLFLASRSTDISVTHTPKKAPPPPVAALDRIQPSSGTTPRDRPRDLPLPTFPIFFETAF